MTTLSSTTSIFLRLMALSGVIPRAGSGRTGPVEIVVVCIVAFILHSHAPTLYHSWLTWQPGFGRKLSPGRVRVVARGSNLAYRRFPIGSLPTTRARTRTWTTRRLGEL